MDYIDAGITPPLYRVRDITGKKVDFTYYKESLDKVDAKNLHYHFHIDQVLEKRKIGEEEEFLVNFKGQPKAFKRWLTKKQFVKK